MTKVDYKNLLQKDDSRTTVGVRRGILDAFNEATKDMVKGGKTVERLMVSYLEADDFERMIMLNPEIPIREILQKMIRDELLFLKREEMIKEALSKHARDPETVQGSDSGSNGAEQEAP